MRIRREAQNRLSEIQMLVMDVDGVLTRGGIFYTDAGMEVKAFDIKDGLGLRVAGFGGLRLALVSGRTSPIVQRRARDLGAEDVLQRIGDKEAGLRAIAQARGIPMERIAFMGDDLDDLSAMRAAGVSIAPADAVAEVIAGAGIVTDAPGGRGAARQAVELILKAQGKWEEAVNRYLEGLAARNRGRRPSGT